jgi:hypothetical protein
MQSKDEAVKAEPQVIIKLSSRDAMKVAVESKFGKSMSNRHKRKTVDYNLAERPTEADSRQRRRALARKAAKGRGR